MHAASAYRAPMMPVLTRSISIGTARRIALHAQGFADRRPDQPSGRKHLARVLARTGLFQIDSVSAVVRAHYMPMFARVGGYPRELLDGAAAGKRRLMFEYWAHEASLLPVESWPLWQWRMERARGGTGIYKGLAAFGAERAAYVEEIFDRISRGGPVAASDFDSNRGPGGWWSWSDAKRALEFLFWGGRITTRERRPSFERIYDLPERALPASVMGALVPAPAEAHRSLLRIAARALGVATAGDLRDYFRLSPADMKDRLEELVEDGEISQVAVRGWKQPAFLHRAARAPRSIDARALLAPFDPLVWERSRAERLFDFRYRIEIYTPEHKRIHGYYVLPFLLGDRIVARVDLRADRAAGTLRVDGAFAEACAPGHCAEALFDELRLMADWLGLERIAVGSRGDLAPSVAEIQRSRHGG